jgi:translation initiation factor 6
MTILKYQIFGSNSVGVYLAVNNTFGLYPSTLIASTIEKIKSTFSAPFFPISIHNSSLIGVYTACNKNGIIVPHIIRDDELQKLKGYAKGLNGDYQIGVLKSLDNAFGNLILCNDKGAIISSFLKEYKNKIEDTLNVETVVYEYVNINLPGSISITNNKGCLVHPLCTDEEIEIITDILKVDETDVSTINRGIPYLSSGAIVNDRSGIFGNACTGPEMMRLTNVLEL